MANLSTKLNLAGLIHARMNKKGKDGNMVDCLIIPIKENHLFIGEKGLYLDLSHFEIKNPKEGQEDSHLVKQSLPKEVYEAMSKEEQEKLPILGNTRTWGSNSNEPELAQPIDEDDDLPF
jgi:hypothetical protein|nr:MAG TPA: hypothetical protein [Caudoviricetes sp.]